ncbi:unnamed protein product [Schistocephalus solidus]|uniref:Uncharacterized protein n=1 Tax=Schistocephalus solidus TaxID=70667 RepID=A0A183SY26_SCHSO|nr:unnamed protein product [Schistocephalus solidus]
MNKSLFIDLLGNRPAHRSGLACFAIDYAQNIYGLAPCGLTPILPTTARLNLSCVRSVSPLSFFDSLLEGTEDDEFVGDDDDDDDADDDDDDDDDRCVSRDPVKDATNRVIYPNGPIALTCEVVDVYFCHRRFNSYHGRSRILLIFTVPQNSVAYYGC